MMRIPSSVVASCAAVWCVGMAVAIGSVPVMAQGAEPAPARTRVATVEVKPDMLRAWLDLQRTEVLPALKKAGVAWRWVFSNGGPVGSGFTYTIVQPIANYAQFDGGPAIRRAMTPEAYQRYLDKERTMVARTAAIVQTLIPSASILSGSSTPPALAVVTTSLLLPLKGPEFTSITASDFVPALKKAGVTDYWVFATNFGAPVGQRTIVQPLSKWADLDSPAALVRALGAEGAQKLNQKRTPLLAAPSHITVVSFVPDLSFGAPPPPGR